MKNPVIKYLINNHVLAALIIVAALWVAIQLQGILVIIFVSYIIMAALSPFSDFLDRKGAPSILSVLIPYSVAIAVLVLLILPLVPFFISQIELLFSNFPKYVDQVANIFGFHVDIRNVNGIFGSYMDGIGKSALGVTGKIFSGFFSVIAVIVISFYLMLQRKALKRHFISFWPEKYHEHVHGTMTNIEKKLGWWLRGQFILSFAIGFFTWAGLIVFGLPYALPLALLAGILEIVPTLGPIISAIPAIIVALTISPGLALIIVGFYILLQTLENNILVPKIMEKAVGLNPIIIIIGVLIGGKFMGILGALLAVPLIAVMVIIAKSLKLAS